MKRNFLVGFTAILLGFSACSSSVDEISEEEISQTIEINSELLIDLVNEVRASGTTCGNTYYPPVDAIVWNNKLEQAAVNHSKDMHENNFFSHESPDGSTLTKRLREVCYNYSKAGENIAKGYLNEQQVLNGWLVSEGHCANIMNGNFKEMGEWRVGNYWTQNFGAQR
ncbi:CAP domain-containing protein [Marinifilum fragile]|uniref:CAP domain-containing protein n=1 Tax=Marinifilum fragile TaxID=570161 RepID=UPI0006D2922E|nr:CAP domain-containing protein [Marinifilum fragile]